jgi:transglutaminase-like putative cysteine protease
VDAAMLKNLILPFFICLFVSSMEEAVAAEPDYKFVKNYYSYKVNPDGSYSLVVETAIKLLKEDALESSRQQTISYSTSVEKVDIIAAYTQKPKGQRVEVPKANYQLEVNSGKDGKDSPAFSDRTTLTIIFPDVAVGDTVYWRYQINQTEPLFLNHFSVWRTFSNYYVYDDVQIDLDVPAAMPIRYELTAFKEKKSIEQNGRKLLHWSYQNKKSSFDKNDWGDIYYFGKDPGYIISTFPSFASISHAYGIRAKEKAVVTKRIQKLADDITKGKSKPYDQAKALYDWVAENISYAGNCIGVGAVVPRDTDFVLNNRMGDCKDHATLLEALLTAKKIPSTQALINSGSIYELPKIPVVAMVNHVMNYLPSLKLFADATAEGTPFGLLPDGEMGKPILLVDGFQDGQKTPYPLHNDNVSKTQTTVHIGDDGTAKGKISWLNQGRLGLFSNTPKTFKQYREFINDKEKVDDYSKSMIKRYGFEGGKINYSLDDHPKSQTISTTRIDFDVKGFLNAGSLGAFNVNPVFSSSAVFSTIKSILSKDDPSSDFYCKGEHIEETYIYHFPKNLSILAVPDSIAYSNKLVSFKADYILKDNVLTIVRKIDDVSQGPVCKANTYQAYRELANKVMPNLKSQVVYKYIANKSI